MKPKLTPNTLAARERLIDGGHYLILHIVGHNKAGLEVLGYSQCFYRSPIRHSEGDKYIEVANFWDGEGCWEVDSVFGWAQLECPSAEKCRLDLMKEKEGEPVILEEGYKCEKIEEWPTAIIYPPEVRLSIDPMTKTLHIIVIHGWWERLKARFALLFMKGKNEVRL